MLTIGGEMLMDLWGRATDGATVVILSCEKKPVKWG